MSISLLQEIAAQKLPFQVIDSDQVDEGRVLLQAGLITAFVLRDRSGSHGFTWQLQILSITPDGWRLLRKILPEWQAAPEQSHATN